MKLHWNRQRVACLVVFIAATGLGIFYLLPARPGILAAHPSELRLEMKFGAREEVYVRLENVGGSLAVISGVSSSCGCTVGTPETNQLGRGNSTRLKVEVSANFIGRKDAIVDVAYESLKERRVVRIPVVLKTGEAAGTRVLSYPKDLVAYSDPAKESRAEFEVRTTEKSAGQPDFVELTSEDDRCRFRVLDIKSSEPDRNGKCERTYQIEMIVASSEPFAATAKMRFREPLAAPAGNIAIFARHKARTRLVPSVVDLPAMFAESSPQKQEVLLISEVEIEDWRVADQAAFPAWLSIDVEKLRSNITRVIIADSRTPEMKTADVLNFQLTLNSSAETVVLPVRIRD